LAVVHELACEVGVVNNDAPTPQCPSMRHIPMRLFSSLHVANNLVTQTISPFGAHDTPSQCMKKHEHDGGDDPIGESIDYFLRSTHVSSKGTMSVAFFVDNNIFSIKIPKIPSIYEYLNYFLLSN